MLLFNGQTIGEISTEINVIYCQNVDHRDSLCEIICRLFLFSLMTNNKFIANILLQSFSSTIMHLMALDSNYRVASYESTSFFSRK